MAKGGLGRAGGACKLIGYLLRAFVPGLEGCEVECEGFADLRRTGEGLGGEGCEKARRDQLASCQLQKGDGRDVSRRAV